MKHVIVGNGPAGVVAAETLRKVDPAATITLIGDEPEPPYSRMALPYLMMGDIAEAGTYLRKTPDHFAKLRIDLVRDRVEAVDTKARTVKLESGPSLTYDRLLIASGSHPIKPDIPGIDLPGVHACWTMADARLIIARAAEHSRVLQVGAGFIGCIIMEALVSRGVRLTVVEMGDRMVPRMMTPVAGNMIRAWCERKGVAVRVKTRVTNIRAVAGGGDALVATLDSGEEIEADLIIVAAGVRPNVGFLRGSGIDYADGIPVDGAMQTNVPGVHAAGDVAEGLDPVVGKRVLNAIQPTAVDQARIAALNMAGRHVETRGNLTLNVLDTLGLISSSFGKWWSEPGGQTAELIDEAEFRYLSLQFSGDVLVGATSIGLTEHVGVLRGLIEGRVRLGPWKDRLLNEPLRVTEAYLARAQAAA
jgi:NADPH-dependent 2,4-dienoyl-CoA reductase/sulfur reductase-like enzyme